MNFSQQKSTDPDSIMFSARGLQALVGSFEDGAPDPSDAALFQGQFIALPVLLAFAMELALKAWWVIDNKGSDVPKTHDLVKLFEGLSEDTRTLLESETPEIPSPTGWIRPLRPGLRSLLESNRSAFIEWRYIHERSRARFPIGEFKEALSSVIGEFDRAPR